MQAFPAHMDGKPLEPGRRFGIITGPPARGRRPVAAMIRHIKDVPAAFGPDLIRLLSRALDEAWRSASAGPAGFKLRGHESAVRDVLARHIVDMAKKGVREHARLVENALIRLRL